MWVGNNGGERGALRSKRVDLKDMVVVVVVVGGGWKRICFLVDCF